MQPEKNAPGRPLSPPLAATQPELSAEVSAGVPRVEAGVPDTWPAWPQIR